MRELPLTIKDAARALRSGELTSVELTKALLERADRLDPILGVYITRMDRTALEEAERADIAFKVGVDKGPLQGIPLGLKDILSTENAPTTAQSLVIDPDWGKQGDAVVVSRLRQAGAVIMGKTTTHEFAAGAPDDEKPFPIPHNPWNTDYHTGGSSSGTGGGIAAGFFLGGLGTDTGGSVRGPSAFCGISGIRPTYGRVPKSGCTQNGFSLDTIGPMARSVWDIAAMLEVMAGAHVTDITSLPAPVAKYTDALDGDLTGLRVGIVRESFTRNGASGPEVAAAFDEAGRMLEEAGATVTDVVIPIARLMGDAHAVNNAAEKSGIYLKRLQERWLDWGRFTRIGGATEGLFINTADYIQCLRVRRYAQKYIAAMMQDYDIFLTPTAPGTAPRIAEMGHPTSFGGLGGLNRGMWSLVGLPSMAIPMGFASNGLPLSLQVTGRPFEEATVFKVGDAYQRLTGWHLRVPPLVTSTLAAV